MADMIQMVVEVTIVLFMVANLLDMGLRLDLREALAGLRNLNFVAWSLLWGYVFCPALAWLLTRLIPLDQPYAIGMIMLGMVPCAPILPLMVKKARGDLAYTGAFVLITSIVTVVYMPFAVPLLAEGFAADSWTIGKPLLFFILVPLLAGLAIQSYAAPITFRILPFVNITAKFTTYFLLALAFVVYGKGFLNAIGTHAIGIQILFYSLASAASYLLSPGLTHRQKSVLSLGMSTRNLGAAFVPLLAVPGIDERALVMVALAVPIQFIISLFAARVFARHTQADKTVAAEISDRS
jgi:BASS family bile acid:Na+ symporter